ncbi:MAG: efflux RND transporter periplasmic adaptor subunit [Methyloprofundus sp.]|nr:efflux RND transporter periplasmic adaptor subunit [Methyloprofundus sp.]
MKRSYLLVLILSLCLIGLALKFTDLSLLSTDQANPSEKVALQTISEDYYAGPFKVQITVNPEQPRVGKNSLKIIIRDKDNQPINHANLEAIAEMPAMGSMPTMYAPADITSEALGLYQGQFQLPMMGAWPITLKIDAGTQGQAELSFDMGTSRKGLSLSAATPSPYAPKSTGASGTTTNQDKIFKVDSYRRQLIGVTTEAVTCIRMKKLIHASAKITYDQTSLTDISLKFDGWIENLNADFVGKKVKKGQTLFSVYSPELISSQDEYLQSYRRSLQGHNSLKEAAARRLSLWGINRSQIRALERRGRALESLPIRSPITGTIIEKNIVAGSAFKTSNTLLRIADLSKVWVEGQVYEADLAWIELGMPAQVIVENKPDAVLIGEVTFIEPFVENQTRAARIRVELDNTDGLLRPEQYVHLQLQVNLGERLVVPEEAVVFTGENRVVFMDLGEGRLKAQKIKTGVRNDKYIEVLEGLEHDDLIVSSGNFLIASESKLKLGVDQW